MCWGSEPYTCTTIFQDVCPKSLWVRYFMNRWLARIQMLYGGYLGISGDLINFWGEFVDEIAAAILFNNLIYLGVFPNLKVCFGGDYSD